MADLRISSSSLTLPPMPQVELARGDKGDAVANLQQRLNEAGSHLAVDGDLGPKTEQAIKDFQQQHGLKADGIVGHDTRAALAQAAAPEKLAEEPSGHLDLNKELSSPDSRLSVAIGMAEGTRTQGGGYTRAYEGHRDPVSQGKNGDNLGTFSYQGKADSPAKADQLQLESMRQLVPKYEEACHKAGVDPSNPVLAGSVFDLYNQAPKAVTGKGGLLDQLPALAKQGLTKQNIAEARYKSFYDPDKGQFDTNFKSLADLKADQQRRTGEIFKGLGGADRPVPQTTQMPDLGKMKQAVTEKLDEFLKSAGSNPPPEPGKFKQALSQEIGQLAKTFGATQSDVDRFNKEVDTKVDQFCKAFEGHTVAPQGKIGYGSQGKEVQELKQALKDAGFYKGAVNDKMGEDGVKALAAAKTALNLGGAGDVAGPETVQKIKEYAAWPSTHVPVDFIPQWNSTACSKASEAMMRETSNPAHRAIPGPDNTWVNHVSGGAQDPEIRYMQSQLKSGKPVMLGVYHGTDPSGSRAGVAKNPGAVNGSDNLYDIKHYVVATGTGRDAKGEYITFNDPAEKNASGGLDSNPQNRLYLDQNGRFTGQKDWAGSDTFELRGVVHNK